MNQFVFQNIRIQFFSEDIVRLEYNENGTFCDENTFFIPHKARFAHTTVAFAQKNGSICFGEYELSLPQDAKSLSGLQLYKYGQPVYVYEALENSGELPPLDQTPEVFALADNPRILVPEGGYSAQRRGEYEIEEEVQDIYLLLCRKNAKLLRRLYVELTGRSEMVRLSTLGGWNSKYYAYNEEEAKQLILDYEKHHVPLDVMVIDTDWRSCENGWGYDINTKLFPDMERFLKFAHDHGVEIMFNDHPEPVDGAQVFAPEEIAYREKNLQRLMDMGLDIWWYDRNWSTNLVSPTKKVRWESFGLYLFQDITRHYWQKKAQNQEVYRRPVIMGNVVNIPNGAYQSILDSASHRYSIQWTGDIDSEPYSLAQEVANLLRCGNNAIPYANADCGGHLGNPDKEGFIRWMQFGTLSPVFRPHCTNIVKRFREPWVYDEETLEIVRAYNHLRYRLLPILYRNTYQNYVTGDPIFKSLAFEYPDDKTAAACTKQYMLGNDLLIRPIAGPNPTLMEPKRFTKPVNAVYFNGTELQGEPIAKAQYDKLNIALNHTAPEAGVPVYDFSARFDTEVLFDQDVELMVLCDDGATVWVDGEKVFEDHTLHSAMYFPLNVLSGGKPHKLEIEYFQAGGEAAIGLYYCEIDRDEQTHTYLPAGKWMDVFSGEMESGEKTVSRNYGLREMPLFVRLGALLPLAYEAKNTKEQKWDRLVYDFYPSRDASDRGYLYEDDTETTAYQLGAFRLSAYEAAYCPQCQAFVVNIHAAQGGFDGEKCFQKRKIVLRYHLLEGADSVKKVTVNGETVPFTRFDKDSTAFPLNSGNAVPDSAVLSVPLEIDVCKEYELKFHI